MGDGRGGGSGHAWARALPSRTGSCRRTIPPWCGCCYLPFAWRLAERQEQLTRHLFPAAEDTATRSLPVGRWHEGGLAGGEGRSGGWRRTGARVRTREQACDTPSCASPFERCAFPFAVREKGERRKEKVVAELA